MKKTNNIFNESAAYESPQIHILYFEVEGVLCQSPGSLGGGDGEDSDYEQPGFGGDLDFNL